LYSSSHQFLFVTHNSGDLGLFNLWEFKFSRRWLWTVSYFGSWRCTIW
jgi:hypothetical protein